MKREILSLFTAAAVCASLCLISCSTQEDDEKYPEVTLRGTEVRSLHSTIVDEDYQLHVYLPPSYRKGGDSNPVLYLTDSEGFFGFVRAMVASLQYTKQIPEMIIIGIGYEERGQTAWDNRRRDHLPAVNEDLPGSGGADRFLQFMQKELVPFVDSSYRTDPEDRIFAGMSSGGTLGAYVLVTSPETFNRYLIVSPALHSGNEMILDLEKQYFEAQRDLPATVYSAMGEHEPDYMHAPWNTLTDNLEKRNYRSLLLTTEIIDGGTHMDAVYCAYVRGLKAIYSDYKTDEK